MLTFMPGPGTAVFRPGWTLRMPPLRLYHSRSPPWRGQTARPRSGNLP